MRTATLDGPAPEGMIRVQVMVKAEGSIDMFMTRDELEAMFDENDFLADDVADPVVEAAGDDLLNSLTWEVEMAEECSPPKKKGARKTDEKESE
jgi:hypothetical protein